MSLWTNGWARHLTKQNLILAFIVLAAFIVRIWSLEMKPPHFDEGINGHFVMQMWKDGFYRYDPTNFHGPLYFYFLQMSEVIFGRGIFGFRFVTLLFSVGTVLVVGLHKRFFGNAALWAAAMLAFGPASVFYARYAIHEWLFILLQVIFVYGFYLYREEKSRLAVTCMVAGFLGTFAVKETFFVFFGTWLIAIYVERFTNRLWPADKPVASSQKLSRKERKALEKEQVVSTSAPLDPARKADFFAITAIGVMIVLALFSGFFVHMEGILDMFRAFMFWTKTGTAASGHEKPFVYWIELLWRYEWPGLLALALSPIIYFNVSRPARVMVVTSFGTWLAYSLIPYKTPWLILNILWPLAFTLGFAVEVAKKFAEKFAIKPLAAAMQIVILFTLATAAQIMLRLNFVDFVNPKEAYVYVQSTMQFKNAMDWINARVKQRPEDLNMKLLVLNKDTWPMPWLLGGFPNLNWGKPEDADLTNASVILIDASMRETLEKRLTGKYWVQPFHIRDAYDEGWAYFEFHQFQGILPSNSPIFDSATKKEGGQG